MATALRDRSDLLEQLEIARGDLEAGEQGVSRLTAGMRGYAAGVSEAVTWLLEAKPVVDEIRRELDTHAEFDRAGEGRSVAWTATLQWFLGLNDEPAL